VEVQTEVDIAFAALRENTFVWRTFNGMRIEQQEVNFLPLPQGQYLKRPVPYQHPQGAVIWVQLDDEVERKIIQQLGLGKETH
jgi:hypothetical protein